MIVCVSHLTSSPLEWQAFAIFGMNKQATPYESDSVGRRFATLHT